MSDWKDYLNDLEERTAEAWDTFNDKPGKVMICFVNRYLEGMDDIKYKIHHDLKTFEGKTTASRYCVALSPTSLKPIEIYVWSRKKNDYKKLDDVVPEVGNKKLVRKIIKSYKAAGKTEKHPANAPIVPPPKRPAPAPTPAPSPTDRQGVTPLPKPDESGLPQTQVERPVPDKVTKEQLKKIFPKAELPYLQQIADELNKDLAKFKLDTPVRRAHFFGQTRQETGTAAKGRGESFDHTSARLMVVFGYYARHRDEARQDGRLEQVISGTRKIKITQEAKEEVIANKAYGPLGVGPRLGNRPGTDDGWRYRGRGLKQTTGKANYENFTEGHQKYWGEKIDFVANPDLVAQFPYSVRSAVVFWLKNECWKAADKGMNDAAIDAVTRIVNSGEIKKHRAGGYKPENNPVLNRRKYAHLAYSAFT